jgi:hypothetical protein
MYEDSCMHLLCPVPYIEVSYLLHIYIFLYYKYTYIHIYMYIYMYAYTNVIIYNNHHYQ